MMLIVAAMLDEVKAIIKDARQEEGLYILDEPDTRLLLTGVGKVNAAAKLSSVLARSTVDVILNLGFAGATPPYESGDVVLVKQATYHDFDLSLFGYQKGQVPGCPDFYASDETWSLRALKKIPNLKTGTLYTGDVFMTTTRDEACLVDMEGTSLFQTAYLFKVPMMAIKVVSDIIGITDHLKHYQIFAAKDGAKALQKVYDHLCKGA